jgi:hypothetical protein
MQRNLSSFLILTGAALLSFLPAAIAHGHDEDMSMDIGMPKRPTIPSNSSSDVSEPLSYFQYGKHTGLMFAHIFLMTLAWVFVLPIGEHSLNL